jgi:hypothetical protein
MVEASEDRREVELTRPEGTNLTLAPAFRMQPVSALASTEPCTTTDIPRASVPGAGGQPA